MPESVKLIECPRDAWQGLAHIIPPDTKAAYLRALIDAGFTHIDAVSFVSPKAVPQMADSESVLELLGPTPGIELIGIVVNPKGAERAIATGHVSTLGFPYSISPAFLRRNQNQSQADSLTALKTIASLAQSANLNLVAYISMAFGNPYNDPWSIDALTGACHQLIQLGVKQISLADTVGRAKPDQISAVLISVLPTLKNLELGVHLHARRNNAVELIRAAYSAGCRRFDSAIGGLGGCPFAQDDLVGNIPTETLLQELKNLGATLPATTVTSDLLNRNSQIATCAGVAS